MLTRGASYEEIRGGFHWRIPDRYNIAVDVCDRHADAANRPALIVQDEAGAVRRYGFLDLKRLSNQLANALTALGVERGDRVGILLSQSVETALAHLATYKMGGIALPLFTLFGEDALEYRLKDAGARVLITNGANLHKVAAIRERLPDLQVVLAVDGGEGALDFWPTVEKASDAFMPLDTAADDPALIIYTSGTTGNPKGALHAHRVLLGHLPGVEFPHDFFPQPGDLFWTPADWAWIGGLLDVLLPAWHHGVPVLAHRAGRFDPERAYALIAEHEVRNVFMPPTALRLMRQVRREGNGCHLRSIGSGGETLGAELLDWGRETFGVTINEFYGQTECNLVVGNCAALMPPRPGSMGRPIPGHTVEIVDDEGTPLPVGETGNIAVLRPDPTMFLEYWRNPEATRAKFADGWLLTGDMGRKDDEGYLWFFGRDDDIITSAGYRIGPGEIEECPPTPPAVARAAAVGVPDPRRTEVVKAFVVLRAGHAPDDGLKRDIQEFVKARLAAHEYPRLVEFVDSLPMTATGKIKRRDLRGR